MKSRKLTFAFIIVFTFILSASSFAQFESSNREKVGIRLSAFRPSNSYLKGMGSTWLSPSLDVHLKFDELDRPTSMISIGWFGGEDNSMHTKASMVPVTATYLKYFSKSPAQSWYVGGGLGMYYNKFQTPYSSNTGSQLGANIIGGMTFSGGWFAEIRYDQAGSISVPILNGNVDFGGLSVCFGSHMGF